MSEDRETRIVGDLQWTYRLSSERWEGPCGLILKYVIKEDLNGSWVLFTKYPVRFLQDMETRSVRQAMIKASERLASSLPLV